MFVIIKEQAGKLKLGYKECMSEDGLALEKAKQLALTCGTAGAIYYVCECKYKVFVGMQVEKQEVK